jgi:endonuclease VIII
VPEGDTIYRAAATLNRALAGRSVVRFESVFPALTRVHDDHPLTEMTVDKVQSLGKHLLMYFSGGLVLRTHMRMHGSWHIYRPGERWRQSARDMRVLVATADFEAVGFNIPVAEFIRIDAKRDLAKHAVLAKLGPDALDADFDRAEAVRRLRTRPSVPIADALLDQRLLAGLGNVFKSEVLFTCGISPFVAVATLDHRRLEHLVDTGRKLLQANVRTSSTSLTTRTGRRRTTGRDNPSEGLWVYGRARLPCRRCGATIEVRKHGTDARLTYWCPECQMS